MLRRSADLLKNKIRSRVCIKSGKFNRWESPRKTAKKRKAYIYKIITLCNFELSLRNSAVNDF